MYELTPPSLEVINPKDSICAEDDTVPVGVEVRYEPVSALKICIWLSKEPVSPSRASSLLLIDPV